MTEMTELVDLPDPNRQPLVHPLDLPAARRLWHRSRLIGALANPATGLCVAAIVWFGTHHFLPPLIAGATIAVFGGLASYMFASQAWQYIPRRRQDRERTPPIVGDLGAALALAVVAGVALLLLAVRLGRDDIGTEVRQFTFGAGAMVCLLMIVELAALIRRPRRALVRLPAVLAVIGGLAAAYSNWFDPASPYSASTVWGAAMLLAVGVGVAIWQRVEARRR